MDLGNIHALATTPSACFSPTPDGRGRQSPGPVLINGITITPKSGLVVITPQLNSGTIQTTGPYTVGLGTLLSFDMENPLDLDGLLSGGVAGLQRTITLLFNDIPKAFGLPLRRNLKLEFLSDDGGTTKLTITIVLPEAFRATPDGGAPLTGTEADKRLKGIGGDVTLIASNNKGVSGAGKLTISELYLFGKFKLKDLSLGFDFLHTALTGSVGIALPSKKL
ncbi:MAG: hypothetical protein ACTHMY_27385, partial [Solirubrobacteraceae bacterium]